MSEGMFSHVAAHVIKLVRTNFSAYFYTAKIDT